MNIQFNTTYTVKEIYMLYRHH